MEKTLPPSGRAKFDTLKMKPSVPRKETPRRKDAVRASSVAESLQECDEHFLAISKCDDKIAKFKELLKQMCTNLYGSIEAISEKINQIAVAVDPPRRKRVSRIISNVQLVPPRSIPQREECTQEELDFCSEGEGWTEVRSRKKKKSVRIDTPMEEPMEVVIPAANVGRPEKHPSLLLRACAEEDREPLRCRLRLTRTSIIRGHN